MLNAGTAWVGVKPDMSGIHTGIRSGLRGVDRQFDAAGQVAGQQYTKSFGSRFLGGVGTVAKRGAQVFGTGLVLGAVAATKSAIGLEQEFGSTMNQIGAATEAPKKQLRSMSKLALSMGRDTIFSANESSQAMLELAKGGMSAATIQAGGLKGTLTLAAAGGTDMATAATIASDALNVFNLKGRDMKGVASALAGGANASSASIESLGLSLSQAGLSAASAGLSVQETVATLAAFDQAGLKGSDAGTSLKNMLARLVPTTKEAYKAMGAYGLVNYNANTASKVLAKDGIKATGDSFLATQKAVSKYLVTQGVAKEGTVALATATDDYLQVTGIMHNAFLKQNGDYKSISSIAGTLKDKLSGLSQSERDQALQTIFGNDARRAATVLMREGEKGLARYIKKTSDMGAAQRMADSRMKGTAGAIEQMKGSLETAGLELGIALKPATIGVANLVSGIAKKAIPHIRVFGKWLKGALGGEGGNVFERVGGWISGLLPKLRKMSPDAKAAFAGIGPALLEAKRELPSFSDMLTVTGIALGFLADHADLVAKALPYLAGAFLVVKAAQAASNVAATVAVPLRIAEVFANRRLAASNKALVASITTQTAATRGSTVAEVTNTGAKNKGIVASVRSRVATIGKSIAERASAGASLAAAGATRLFNAAMRANPIGIIVTLLIALGAGLVLAYKKSETFRRIVNGAWAGIKRGAAAVSGWFTKSFLPFFTKTIPNAFSFLVGWVKGFFKKHWMTILAVLMGPIALAALAIYKNWDKITSAFSAALKWVRSTFATGYAKVKGWITGPVESARDGVQRILGRVRDAFSGAVKAIGRVWDGLKAIVKAPVRFVVDTVINNGVIDAIRSIQGFVGVKDANKLGYVKLPKGFAEGGVLPGFTPRRDVHRFVSPTGGRLDLSGGEAFMVPEWTRAVGGPREVARQNKLARAGRLHGALPRRRFAGGGTMPVPGDGNQHAGYPWASYAGDFPVPLGTPVKSYLDGMVAFTKRLADSYGNHVGINHPGGVSTLYAHLSEILVRSRQKVREGQVIGRSGSTGNSTGPHLHFEISGAPFGISGDSGDAGGGLPGWISSIISGPKEWMSGFFDKLATFGSSPLVDMLQSIPGKLAGSVGDKIKSMVGNLFDPGVSATVSGPARQIVQQMAAIDFGWTGREWLALAELIQRESSWDPNAANPNSSARGLFQKMTSLHGPVEGTVAGQARWGLNYIKGRYGTPSGALRFHDANGSYDAGGWLKPGQTGINRSAKPEPVFTNAQWQLLKKAITGLTMNEGRPINVAWLRRVLDPLVKDAGRLRREFIRSRDAMRGFRTRRERAERTLDRIRESERYERRAEAARRAQRAFKATRSGEAIGADVADTRTAAAKALRQARRSALGRDALRDYRQASRKLEKLRTADVVAEATRRTKWRRAEAAETLKNANAPVVAARKALKKSRDDVEKAKGEQDKADARRAVRRARVELQQVRGRPDSERKQRARDEVQAANRRLKTLAEESKEIEQLTKARDTAGQQSDAVKELVASRKRLEALREERKERRQLRRQARRAGRADILKREEKAQERLNDRIAAEKKARDAANTAAKAYRAAQQAARERGRTITAAGVELGGIGAAGFKTSGGIVSNLRRAVATVSDWGTIVRSLIGAGLRGPILDEFINEGPSADAVRTGKSLLIGGKLAEINRLQDQLKRASVRAGAYGAASYTPKQRATIRRATPVKYQPSQAGESQRQVHTHVHGMPADTADMIAGKAAARVMYEIGRGAI